MQPKIREVCLSEKSVLGNMFANRHNPQWHVHIYAHTVSVLGETYN